MRPGQGTITSDPPVTAALLPIHATRTPSKKRQLDNQLFHSSDWHRLFLKGGIPHPRYFTLMSQLYVYQALWRTSRLRKKLSLEKKTASLLAHGLVVLKLSSPDTLCTLDKIDGSVYKI